MDRDPVRDVVVVLPGIMGSVLRRDGHDVWSASHGALFQGLLRGMGPIEALRLDGDDPESDDLGDGVTADRLIDGVHLVPGLWSIDGYKRLRRSILALPGVTKGENYFELPYDWRRDNRVAARLLQQRSRVWLKRWRDSAPDREDARLVLIAHSMGGLVSRYFLEVLGGWKETRLLITLGTPYRGSVNALDFLVNGMSKRFGPVTLFDLGDVVRSMTSAYQLLPTFQCWDVGDGAMKRLDEVDHIPNADPDRLAAAREFHAEISDAAAVNARDDRYRDPATGYVLHPIVGVSQPTVQSARVNGGNVTFLKTHGGRTRDGDGRVLEESAVPEGSTVAKVFYNQAHASLQNDDAATVQVQTLLTPPKDELRVRGRPYRFGVEVADAVSAGSPVVLNVTVQEDVPPLRATIFDTEEAEPVVRDQPLRPSDDGYEGELPPLVAGTYRVVVDGDDVAPVADTFVAV